jgi:hypothetical protein
VFPLVPSGLEGVGGEWMGPVAALEFRGPPEWGVGAGNQEGRDRERFLLRLVDEKRRPALRFRFLFRGKNEVGPEHLTARERREFFNAFQPPPLG